MKTRKTKKTGRAKLAITKFLPARARDKYVLRLFVAGATTR